MTPLAIIQRDMRPRLAALMLASVILFYYLALGGNTGLLAMIGAALCIVAALIILLLLEPGDQYWKHAWPGLASLCWLILVAAMPKWLNTPSSFLVPDLFDFGMARMFGVSAILLAGTWVGFRRSGLRHCVLALIIVGTIDIGVGLVMRTYTPFEVWGISKGINAYRFTGTLLNANASACLFSVTAVLSVGTLQDCLLYPVRSGPRTYLPLVMIVTALLAIGACATTGSRAALLLTLLAIGGMLAWDQNVRRLIFNRQGLFVSSGVAVMLMIMLLAVGDTTFGRIALLEGDFAERVAIWSRFAELAAHAPSLGYGPASFTEASKLAMQTPADARLLWYVNSAHNIILSLLIEHGIIFLAVLTLTAGMMLAPFTTSLRQAPANPVRASAIVACLVIVCCASVDIALDVPAVGALFALLIGLVWGQSLRAHANAANRSRQQGRGAAQDPARSDDGM